jgi:regulator of protease activity HflC (stomatin/prohibitin superfamily)
MKKLIFNLAIAATVLSFFSCREKIDAGNVGLLINQYGTGKGQGVEIVAGSTWYNPWTEDVIQIPAFVQHKEFEKVTVNDKNGTEWTMTPTLDYRIEKGTISDTYRKYRKPLPELEEGVIKTIVKESCRFVINNYSTDSIMGSRGDIEKQIKDRIKITLQTEGFNTENFTSGLYPPKAITESITLKNRAIQDAMRIQNEVKSTEAEAKKKVAQAKGSAESLLINARAEAEANRLKQQSLTPMLIQQQWIQKWNGNLPETMTGSGSNLMIGINK